MKYKRVLLKLSGEYFAGGSQYLIDFDIVESICATIKEIVEENYELAIVLGGGNFWRGRENSNMSRPVADKIGMLATVMNALTLQDCLTNVDVNSHVMTSYSMPQVALPVDIKKAKELLSNGEVVIFGGGTGNPFFSTDTAAALRAAEIDADVFLKATLVDGVYNTDPKIDPSATKYDTLTFNEMIDKRLNVLDKTASSLSMDTSIPILVFNLDPPSNILKAIKGEKIGTVITN